MKSQFISKKIAFPFLGILLVSIFLVSCKKDSSPTENSMYQMSFKANGTQVNYKTIGAVVATFSNTSKQYLGVFSGYDATSNMGLQVYDDTSITTKSYTGYASTGTGIAGVLIGYQDNSGTLYSEAGDDAVVTVSSITATSVTGTFSGTLKADGKADIVISDGKFTLQRLN